MITTPVTSAAPSSPAIKRRVDIVGTLRAMQPGQRIRFRAKSFAPFASARSAVSRLNRATRDPLFLISTDDNGESYIVIRK